ncbi:MAG: hypothetical protein EOO15_24835 [Chitinophagaceae bacterium]|nr:MAG: hypothetical protein EOO15_24835 [Chitinophagaceae bacterium]
MRTRKASSALITAIALTACSTSQRPAADSHRVSVQLSGTGISLSAPQGHFKDVNLLNVDLAENRALLTTLFERAWVERSLTGDKGALEVKLLLAKRQAGQSENFVEAVQQDYKSNLSRAFQSPILGSVYPRQIGNMEWICFGVEDLRVTDCVRELPYSHYLIWRRNWIANRNPIPSNELAGLVDQIEQSVRISSVR